MARRVYVGLHSENPAEQLVEDVAAFLKGQGGSWEGRLLALHEELGSDSKPPTPEASIRKLKILSDISP
jgi:hypothetical protein